MINATNSARIPDGPFVVMMLSVGFVYTSSRELCICDIGINCSENSINLRIRLYFTALETA